MYSKFAASLLYAAFLLQNALVHATEWHPAFEQLHRRADNMTATGGNSTKTGNSTGNSTKPSGSSTVSKSKLREDENWRLATILGISWLVVAAVTTIYVTVLALRRHVRLTSCLNNDNQRYFSIPNEYYGWIKRHLLDAPLFKVRHHREFKVGALHCGALPSRAQFIFLNLYFVIMIILTTYHVDYDQPRNKILEDLTARTGLMALMNLGPLFVFAGRNNPLINWTGISFDTYNLLHRWMGRVVFLEVIAHVTCYFVRKVETTGWQSYVLALQSKKSNFILAGTITASIVILIMIQSLSPLRHAFYETFLHVHQVLAVLVLVAIWTHMKGYSRQRNYLKFIIAVWIIERGFRIFRLLYRNMGRGGSRAEVTALEGDVVRLKVRLARPWKFTPGQHAYVYMPFVGLWTSHPFSVAWGDEDEEEVISDKESLPKSQQDVEHKRHCNIYFLIKRSSGFTHKLWEKARKDPTRMVTTTAWVEGPYNSQKLDSYGTVLLFAAGIGITHQVPHVRELVRGYGNGIVATRRVVLVWVVKYEKHLEWIRDWMTEILALPRRREVLKVLLFITRSNKNNREVYSPTSSVQMIHGRPDFQAIVDQEIELSIGAVGVSVCGTGAVADQVRAACRSWMGRKEIDFEEESFSW